MIREFIAEIQKEEWYKLSNGCICTHSSTLPMININLTYREMDCVISVAIITSSKTGHALRIQCVEPGYATTKARRTKSVSNAVRIVCETFSESIEKINDEIVMLREREEAQRLRDEQRQNILNSFKRPITQSKYQASVLTFIMSKNYQFHFSYTGEPGNEKFDIINFTGDFTSAQIEKFIECLAECPEAAADRLINGK